MSHDKKTITIIISAVLVLALVIGWCSWRKHVTSVKEAQTSASVHPRKSKSGKEAQKPVLTDGQKEQNKAIALQMEKDMRNWGSGLARRPTPVGQTASRPSIVRIENAGQYRNPIRHACLHENQSGVGERRPILRV